MIIAFQESSQNHYLVALFRKMKSVVFKYPLFTSAFILLINGLFLFNTGDCNIIQFLISLSFIYLLNFIRIPKSECL